MNNLLVKKWYKVQLIAKSKTFKITKQVFNTKAEGIEKGISKGYEILNLRALNKLLLEGWIEYQEEVKTVSQTIVEPTNNIEFEAINPEIEAQILKYTNEKIERDILKYEEKKRKENTVNLFLSTPPKQVKHKPFNFDKYSLTDSQYKSNVKAVIGQRADYCGEVIEDATV